MSKKKPLTPDLQAECSAANELFLAKKNELRLTQKKIADAAGISPAAVAQYLNGTNPLNAKFAATLSRLIDEPVEKFSQRLANEIADMAKVVTPAEPARAAPVAPDQVAAEAEHRADMLAMAATPRSREILGRIARAAEEGRLTEDDLDLLDQIAARFENRQADPTTTPARPHQRLREKLKRND